MLKIDMTDFTKLKTKFSIIFEHATSVPGFADSVKHVDGFLNICKQLEVNFLRDKFTNSRSQTSDCADPTKPTGYDQTLDELSTTAKNLISLKRFFICTVDLNSALTNNPDGHSGAAQLTGLSTQQKLNVLKESLVRLFVEQYNNEKQVNNTTTKRMILDDILTSSEILFQGILFRFQVHGMPIIGPFATHSEDLTSKLKNGARNRIEKNKARKLITIHLRRGDISVFPLRNKYIACWGNFNNPNNRSALPEIIDDPSKSVYPYYELTPFLDVVKTFTHRNPDEYEIAFLCDGFERGIARIERHQSTNSLSTAEMLEIEMYAALTKTEYIKKVESLKCSNIKKVNIIWGESGENFLKSFAAIASADIFLLSSGGFGKTIFNYFNFIENSVAIGPCTESSFEIDLQTLLSHKKLEVSR